MKLVKPTSALKKSKRVGRGHGSGLGTTAGRGHKGCRSKKRS
jgi:large subunit ribosomal protein L15